MKFFLGFINYQQSMLLLKCCGCLSFAVKPEERIDLVNKVLSILEHSGN